MTGADTTARPLLPSERLRVALLMVPDGVEDEAEITLNPEAARALLDEFRSIRVAKAAEADAADILAEARELLAEAVELSSRARRDMIRTLAGGALLALLLLLPGVFR